MEQYEYLQVKAESVFLTAFTALADSKTLLWSTDPKYVFGTNEDFYPEKHKVVDLKISDAATVYGVFALIKHSEFLQMLNYHLIMRYENGALHRHHNRWMYDANQQFGMLEPEPLGYNNVLFPFMCLGLAICTAIVIAMVEISLSRWNNYKKRPTEPERLSGIERARTPSSERKNVSEDKVKDQSSQNTLEDKKGITYRNKTYIP